MRLWMLECRLNPCRDLAKDLLEGNMYESQPWAMIWLLTASGL